nr:hypothetical protein [uncultured Pseudomonas sp.]
MKPTPQDQSARAEQHLSKMLDRFPHVEAPKPKLLPELLAQRLEMYLANAVEPGYSVTAMELIASAKELIFVAFALDAVGADEYRRRHAQILEAQRAISLAQEGRGRAARKHFGFDDGVRPAASEDGAYRFNPLTGQHE